MPDASASHVIRNALPFGVGAIMCAAIVVVPLELVVRTSDLPSGIEERQLHLFALQMLTLLLAGHLAGAMLMARRGAARLSARTAALAGFAAMALQMIVLMLAGAPLGVSGRAAAALVAGAVATAAIIATQRKTLAELPAA